MGKQYNKTIKRSRRRKYVARKHERDRAAVGKKGSGASKAVKKAAAAKGGAPAEES